jgi:anti-sigma B factor antagonist
MPLLTIREVAAGSNWVVRPIGDLDMATAQEFDDRLMAAARDHRDGLLIVDLAGVDFLDSSGLRVLLTAARAAQADGGRLRLRPGPPSVQRVFEVSGTEYLLPFE